MSTRSLWRALAVGLTLALMSSAIAYAAVSTDAYYYSYGDTVQISGDGMQAGETVAVDVYFPDGGLAQEHQVSADDSGTFADSFYFAAELPPGVYSVVATGLFSGSSFTTTFDPTLTVNLQLFGTDSLQHPTVGGAENFGSVIKGTPLTFNLNASVSNVTDGTSVSWTVSQISGVSAVLSPSSGTFTNATGTPNPPCCTGKPASVGVSVATGALTIGTTYTVQLRETGTSASPNNSPINSNDYFFKFTVVAPANTAPGDPGAPSLDAGSTTPNNSGNFTVDWAASVDSDAGDSVTYELQKHDASTGTFISVATGLTTNSYTFTGEAEGSWTYQVQATDSHSATSGWAADSAPIVKVDKSAPNAPTASATTSSDYTDGSSRNWWKDTVTVTFTDNGDPDLTDASAGSGVDASTLTANQTFTTLGVHTASGSVKDYAGNTSLAGTLDVYVDNSTPTASFSDCPTTALILGSTALTIHWSASDTGSGLSTAASGNVLLDTSTVGAKTANSPAPEDNVGHIGAAATCNYTVIYDWSGFFQPVDNLILNKAKAGRSIPIKFSLSGYQGLNIIEAGYPKVTSFTCPTAAVSDTIEEYVTDTANNGLVYDALSDQYNYVWQTKTLWAGKCFHFTLVLNDGTTHTADFQFVK